MVPCLGTLNNRCRIIIRSQKGTIILTTAYMFRLLETGLHDASMEVFTWGYGDTEGNIPRRARVLVAEFISPQKCTL